MAKFPEVPKWINYIRDKVGDILDKIDLKKDYPEGEYVDYYHALQKKISKTVKSADPKEVDDESYSKLKELLFLLPNLFHLSFRLLFDKNVPNENKGALIAGLAYVIWPIDLIPDTIPVYGYVDDLMVMGLALNKFFDTDDEAINAAVEKYWAGDSNAFEAVKEILDIYDHAMEWLPKKFMKMIKSVFPRSPR